MENEYKIIKDVMLRVKETSPIILMGDAVTDFKKMYSGPIKLIMSSEDVRELVSYYYGIPSLSHPLIIEDLSNLRARDISLVLKLIEEAKYPIILLSVYDKVDAVLLSRCKSIIKYSSTPLTSQFLPAFRGKEAMDEYLSEDSTTMDKNKWMRDNSPMLFYYTRRIGRVSNLDKILNILM